MCCDRAVDTILFFVGQGIQIFVRVFKIIKGGIQRWFRWSDTMDGKIDLFIMKPTSRFASSTVDSLTAVRILKDKGVIIIKHYICFMFQINIDNINTPID